VIENEKVIAVIGLTVGERIVAWNVDVAEDLLLAVAAEER